MWNIVGSTDAEPQSFLKELQQQRYLQDSSRDFQVRNITVTPRDSLKTGHRNPQKKFWRFDFALLKRCWPWRCATGSSSMVSCSLEALGGIKWLVKLFRGQTADILKNWTSKLTGRALDHLHTRFHQVSK